MEPLNQKPQILNYVSGTGKRSHALYREIPIDQQQALFGTLFLSAKGEGLKHRSSSLQESQDKSKLVRVEESQVVLRDDEESVSMVFVPGLSKHSKLKVIPPKEREELFGTLVVSGKVERFKSKNLSRQEIQNETERVRVEDGQVVLSDDEESMYEVPRLDHLRFMSSKRIRVEDRHDPLGHDEEAVHQAPEPTQLRPQNPILRSPISESLYGLIITKKYRQALIELTKYTEGEVKRKLILYCFYKLGLQELQRSTSQNDDLILNEFALGIFKSITFIAVDQATEFERLIKQTALGAIGFCLSHMKIQARNNRQIDLLLHHEKYAEAYEAYKEMIKGNLAFHHHWLCLSIIKKIERMPEEIFQAFLVQTLASIEKLTLDGESDLAKSHTKELVEALKRRSQGRLHLGHILG